MLELLDAVRSIKGATVQKAEVSYYVLGIKQMLKQPFANNSSIETHFVR